MNFILLVNATGVCLCLLISLSFMIGTVNATWKPYEEGTFMVVNNNQVTRYYRFNLTSPDLNQIRDLTIKCKGDCDYIPRLFQCSGNLIQQSCRIETKVGYELKSFFLQQNLAQDGITFYYYLQKNHSIMIANCDPDYCNWVESTTLQIFMTKIVVIFIGCIIYGLGFFNKQPMYEYTIFVFDFLCLFLTFAGFYHLGQSCQIYQNYI